MYYLDLNGRLNGTNYGNISGYGTADVYINGGIVADDVNDWYTQYPYGTTWQIADVKVSSGKKYDGSNITLYGTITSAVDARLYFSNNTISCKQKIRYRYTEYDPCAQYCGRLSCGYYNCSESNGGYYCNNIWDGCYNFGDGLAAYEWKTSYGSPQSFTGTSCPSGWVPA